MRARFHSVLACKKVTVFSQEDDEIHCSKQGQEFKAQAQSLHIEILQSPWLCELNNGAMELFGDCSLVFDDDDSRQANALVQPLGLHAC